MVTTTSAPVVTAAIVSAAVAPGGGGRERRCGRACLRAEAAASAHLHADSGELERAPSATSLLTLSASMSKTETSWPFLMRLAAMGPPMLPRPMKPI